MSRTVVGLVAVGVVVIAVALGVAWRGMVSDQALLDRQSGPAGGPAARAATASPDATAPAQPAAPRAPEAPAPGQSNAAAAPAPAAPAAQIPQVPQILPPPEMTGVPTFDVARIGPDGRAVIAGRAAAGAKIVLLNGGKEIASGEADARGEWVVLVQDPPLGAGQHELRVVQHIQGRAPVTSEQVVVAVVPAPPGSPAAAGASTGGTAASGTQETLVMIAPPKGPATLVQPPSSAGVPRSGDLQLSTLDYDEKGQVTVTGRSTPGTSVRVYMNDRLAGEGAAGADGRWRIAPSEPIDPGKHRLRVDRLSSDGKPVARLEVPFDRSEPKPSGGDTRRLTIVRGDNLWNIARAHYGEGFRYTVIFEANKSQILDPDLIYPGQIFSLPKVN